MSDLFEYKGYQGTVEYDKADKCLFGQVLHIDSLLMYHGQSVEEIEKAFVETVDAYLELCARTNRAPNKPYKGSFNVRVTPALHRAAANAAALRQESLNEFVSHAIADAVQFEGGNLGNTQVQWTMGNIGLLPANTTLFPGQAANTRFTAAQVASGGQPAAGLAGQDLDSIVNQYRTH